jgi:methionyl-tRNA synthetase
MDKKRLYITTTLPYVNAEPHIGHALEFVQADAIARFFRKKLGKNNVFFNVGTDEHGLKVYRKAKEEGLEVTKFVEKYAQRVKDFCKLFYVEYDHFYRTSDDSHCKAAQKFWQRCDEKGDIYKKKYSGLYCVGCERFVTEKDLVDGKCPDHGTVPELKEEENYFFRLSKYKDYLLEWLKSNPEILKPKLKREELEVMIKEIEDISISRLKENLPWGIEVPNDPKQVLYVWFDALTNYVNVIGYGSDEERLSQWWPGIQLFGPDNLRFQGVIWQGMLASVGLQQSLSLLEHGMVLGSDGTKMAKSKDNIISPFEQEKKIGAEVVRFYLLTGISTFADSAYKEEDLINMYNARLANNFGNLLNRVIHLSRTNQIEINNEKKVEEGFKKKVNTFTNEIEKLYKEYEISSAAENIDKLADWGNKYITEEEPWSEKVDKERKREILNNLSYLLMNVIDLYEPIIPRSCSKARKSLLKGENIILFKKI